MAVTPVLSSPAPHGTTRPVGLGLRAIRHGSVVVAVEMDAGTPRVVLSMFLPTAIDGDRLAAEPYRVAFEMPRDPDGEASAEAAAAVAEGRRRQSALAASGLDAIVRQLNAAGYTSVVAGLLVNRTGWITDALSYSLGWPEHVPIAEGLAVRDALRFGCEVNHVSVEDIDEKSLMDVAAIQFGFSIDALNHRLKTLGEPVGKPWRKEQKLACLAGWTRAAVQQ
jgi:hypothetical protein